jgi:4-hydroxy-tetrahydrodipicolinate synthase
LSVVPYYNKPTQEGLYQHYRKIAEAVDLPLILYNVPGRTVADLSNDTTVRLAGVPGIVGVKDATGSMERAADLLCRVPRDFALYSGDDASAMPFMLLGGHGVISVTANVAPKLMHEMCVAARTGNLARARELNNTLLPLHSKLFVEANPIPVKWACIEMGLIPSGMRLPLTPLSVGLHDTLRGALRHANLI